MKRKATALIEKGKEGTFSVYSSDIHSTIIGEGATVAEAKADFENSLHEVLAMYAETGEPLPDELQDIVFEYKYDAASVFDMFNFINVSKFAEWIGISPSLMRHYKAGDSYISERQAKKIENGLHQVATELLQVSL